MPGNITLPDEDGERYTVNREQTSSAEKSLGVCLALDGNQRKQLQVTTRKSQVFKAEIRAGRCSKNDALHTFNNSFMPSLQYPMIATQFDKDKWKQAIQPVLPATLNKVGMVITFSLKVLYGPDLYQGLDVKNPYFLQEIIHIMTYVQELVGGSQTGRLFRSCAKAF